MQKNRVISVIKTRLSGFDIVLFDGVIILKYPYSKGIHLPKEETHCSY